MTREPIAIVGLGGVLPGAATLDDFWDVVERGIDTASEPPADRWLLDLDMAYHPDRARADRVYSRRACFIRDFQLEPTGLDLPPDLLDALDPMVHLALHAGRQAWQDAVTEPVDPERVGVMLGNIVLPTTSASAMGDGILGRRFERELFRVTGVPMPPETRSPVNAVNRWVAGLPAAMLARALGFGGGRLCLDAACASSLFAVELAVDALRSGRLDAVLAGGLSRPDSLYTQMGFSQLLALSPTGRCSPFDHKADGLVVGEGAGVLVLKRLADALSHGDRIRALVHSVGLSNDVEGSLLAPSREGQLRAMTGVYREAGWRPGDVDLVECHATGTPVGDAVEFASLQKLWEGEDAPPGACVIGSVKSNTGHLLTGAGAVGLLKTVLALEHGVLPPTANFERSGDNLDLADSPFRVLQRAESWPAPSGHPRRAAVSGFGFGGTNAHVLLEEAVEPSGAAVSVSVPERFPDPDVAVVGLGARIGPWRDLAAVRQRLFGRGEDHAARPKQNHWGIPAAPLGWFIEELEIPFGRFKIPPREIEEALPQQMLMLQVAGSAFTDARLNDVERLRTGVFVGVELDLNTTNYHLRWSVRARAVDWARRLGRPTEGEEFEHWVDGLCDAIAPALNANRTIGGLGSIVASRVAREFGLGGPSYVLSSEETSGVSALLAATRALQRGHLDCALVGAVDLSGDVRSLLSLSITDGFSEDGLPRSFDPGADGIRPSDGAVALVLKREQDARRDEDRIYAIVRGIGSAEGDLGHAYEQAIRRGCEDGDVSSGELGYVESHGSGAGRLDRLEAAVLRQTFAADAVQGCATASVGHTGAAAGLVSVLAATLSLYHRMLPLAGASRPDSGEPAHLPEPHPWLRDRIDGPRRAAVLTPARSGTCSCVVLEEFDHGAHPDDAAQPLGPTAEGLFVVEADDADGLTVGLRRLSAFATGGADRPAARLAENWWRERPLRPEVLLAVTLVARNAAELESLAGAAADQMERGEDPSDRSVGRIFFARRPLGPRGELAFVYPGSGSQFNGMGREACLQWPGVLREQDRGNDRLRSQLVADSIWRGDAAALTDARTVILSQVALGTIATDLMAGFGVRPDAVVGYSLGETSGLFSLGAWHDRDEMLRRTMESDLFVSSLTGECTAARRAWDLAEDAELKWLVGVVDRSAGRVREVLEGRQRVYLLIVNTPDECVIGGDAAAVEEAVEALGAAFHALQGVPAVHCEVACEVEDEYHDLHLLDTRVPEGVRFYSGASGEAYEVNRERAADSLLAQAIHGVDFPKTVRQAYEDGARIFLEMGPGSSCTRMIRKILEGRAFQARSVSSPTQDEPSTVLRALAMLISERVPVDVGPLYQGMPAAEEESLPMIRVPVGQEGFGSISELAAAPAPPTPHLPEVPTTLPPAAPDLGIDSPTLDVTGVAAELAAALQATETTIQAHEAYLRAAQRTQELGALQVAHQQELIRAMAQGGAAPVLAATARPVAAHRSPGTIHPAGPTRLRPVVLEREQLVEFAVGSIGKVLGPAFAAVDSYPTRVRLPNEPLMLVDRVTVIEGEPQSMTAGRIVTEHDVLEGAWYLDGDRIPTCIAVEAGQADLLLSGYLGIDSETKGRAVYRLLDAVITFHSELVGPGQTIVYDIRILGFFRQGDTWLFRFQFDAAVDGRPLLTMREGSAGFFTQGELDAGKGIVQSNMEQRPQPGSRPHDWRELVPMRKESYDAERLEALRAGDLAKAFGDEFAGLGVERPLTIPGGRMRLVHRVTELDPEGGRYGMGGIVAEADIHPDDWFITCHFVDDEVMPGTLMYECCMHTLRIFLLRMGWVAEEDTATWQPILEVKSRLRCRGQVLASTRVVTYEINVRELGYGPEPYAIVDALMYSDGKPIVDLRDMSVRLTGASREGLESMWARRGAAPGSVPGPVAAPTSAKTVPYDKASILAFSGGKPSAAYGDPYRIFDEGPRRIARLPRPPYQFLDRVISVEGEPFVMKAGTRARAQFDVSPEHWYFASNRQHEIPFAVLLEVALQPCGWLAAYVGSALTSEDNLRFRNLGGDAVQLARMTAAADVITTEVELTSVSTSGGMIIQHYHMALDSEHAGRLYEGTTYFGFFSDQALADQVGMRDAVIHQPSAAELERGASFAVPLTRPFPDRRMRMIDHIELLVADGGPEGLGWIHGSIAVDADAWFFEAHFYQDPVWPGSLGLEAFLQLLKVYAARRWDLGEEARCTSMPAAHKHRWSYRGQILPGCERVEVFASITVVDDERRSLVADGFLVVDGRTIYSMNDFSLEARG